MANEAKAHTQELSDEEIEERILHILSIYPIISPTMLQGGLGPYVKPLYWRPILIRLQEEGKVVEERVPLETPAGRFNTYVKLMLPNTKVVTE